MASIEDLIESNVPVYPRHLGKAPTIRTTPTWRDTNPGGDIFGGWMLSQIDLAGGACAYCYVGGRVVTAGITAMSFHHPVLAGSEVELFCDVERVGHTSITVKIDCWTRQGKDYPAVHVTEGLFTYVALDNSRKPTPIPPKNHA